MLNQSAQQQLTPSDEQATTSMFGALLAGASLSEATGLQPTKRCSRCGEDKSTLEFNRRLVGFQDKCRPCDRANKSARSPIRTLARKMAGGVRHFDDATSAQRKGWLTQAWILHENSMDISRNITELEERSRAGFVYIVSNPAWPDFVKIGHAFDPQDRLASFNTGDPHRAYVLEYSRYFEDRIAAEKGMHDLLDACRVGGEWFRISAEEAFLRLQFFTCGANADVAA